MSRPPAQTKNPPAELQSPPIENFPATVLHTADKMPSLLVLKI